MKKYFKIFTSRILTFYMIIALFSNVIVDFKAFAEDDKFIIEQAIAASEQENASEFISLKSYLCSLEENKNNKRLIETVFNTIQDITNLKKRENSEIQNSLSKSRGYKYYSLINDYYIRTTKKIEEDKRNASELLKNLKISKDRNYFYETKDAVDALPQGNFKNSLLSQFNGIDTSLNLNDVLENAKDTRSKEDLLKLLSLVNKMTNTSEKQMYLGIIKSLEKDRIDYAHSRFNEYNRDKESVTYNELLECIKEVVSPDAISELNKRLQGVKKQTTTSGSSKKNTSSTNQDIYNALLSLDIRDLTAKKRIMTMINKLNVSEKSTYTRRMEELEKPLYDELTTYMKNAKFSLDKKVLEETIKLYSNIVSETYKVRFENDYKTIKKNLEEAKYKESKQYIDILEKVQRIEEERDMKSKADLVKTINSIPNEKIKRELLNKIINISDKNVRRLNFNKVGKTYFSNAELKDNVSLKIYQKNKVIDSLSIDSTNIGITPKAYLELGNGNNQVRVVALKDNLVVSTETSFNKSNLIPKLATELMPSTIENSSISSDTTTNLSINMANILKGDKKEFSYIIVATAKSYADNLSVIQLASRISAPILLLDENDIYSSETLKTYIEVNLNKKGKVFIIGGNGVVSKTFENSLKVNKERLYGLDRYKTNKAILNKCDIERGTPIIICSGSSYADALSISPISGGMDYPILLVNNELTAEDKKFIGNVSPSQIFIIGGNGVVSDRVEEQLNVFKVTRIAGQDRYETSEKVRDYFTSYFKGNGSCAEVSGQDYVSAILGGIYGSNKKIPVVLMNNEDSNIISIR